MNDHLIYYVTEPFTAEVNAFDSRSVTHKHRERGSIYPWNRGNLSGMSSAGTMGRSQSSGLEKENMENRFGNDPFNNLNSNLARSRQDGVRGNWGAGSSGNVFTSYNQPQQQQRGGSGGFRGRGRGKAVTNDYSMSLISKDGLFRLKKKIISLNYFFFYR